MKNPVMKQIYISLLNCKNKLIQTEPTSALFLPLFGESRVTKDNLPAYCEWAIGSRVIYIIATDGKFIPNNAFIKNARRQPVFFQLTGITNHIKTSFIEEYNIADRRQTLEICPFDIYMVK